MKKDIESIDVKKHHDLKLRNDYTFEHGKDLQFVALNADEFSDASTCYPILFIKDKQTGRFFPIALMGLGKDENLFYTPEIWSVPYVPKMLRLEPFSMMAVEASSGEKKWIPSIDVTSPLICEAQGEPLYQSGQETSFMTMKRDGLLDFYNGKATTSSFIDRLLADGLIKSVKFDLGFSDSQSEFIMGLYTIDEEKIRNLPETSVLEFYRKGYLPAIYAMLTSQFNLFDLIRRRQSKDELGALSKLMSLQIVDA